MATNLKLQLEISAQGGAATVGALKAIQGQLKAAREEADRAKRIEFAIDLGQAAKAAGLTVVEFKKLKQETGLSNQLIAKSAQLMASLAESGVAVEDAIAEVAGQMKLTTAEATKLSKALNLAKAGQSAEGLKAKLGFGDKLGAIANKFNEMNQAAQALGAAGAGAFDLLIGSNERLNSQLLKSAATITATSRVFDGGVQVTDPVAAIKALQGPLKAEIAEVEKATQSLVGVTSAETGQVFNTILQNVTQLNGQLKNSATGAAEFASPLDAASKLAPGLVATLGTLGLPIEQAADEINNLLKGEIDQSAQLAKSLGISREMIEGWKAQGTLVSELNGRFQPFLDANALASRSVAGLTSNIQDIVELIARDAGAPFLDALVDALDQVFKFLESNQAAIEEFALQLGRILLDTGEQLGEAFEPLGRSLLEIAKDSGPVALAALSGLASVLVGVSSAIAPILTLLASAVEGLAEFAGTDIGRITVQATAATGAIAALAVGAIPALIASISALVPALVAASAAALPLAAVLALLAGVVRVTFLVKGKEDLKNAEEALETLQGATNALSDDALRYTQRLKSLNDIQAKGGKLTEEQARAQAKYRELAQGTVSDIDDQIAALKESKFENEAQNNTRNIQVSLLERQRDQLNKLSAAIEIEGQTLKRLGTTYEQLEKKAKSAQEILNTDANGDTERFKEAAKELIDLTNQQVELGTLTEAEGIKRLSAIASNAKAEVETQQAAQEAITKIRAAELNRQVSDLSAQITEVEAKAATGGLSAQDAAIKTTALKRKQLDLQVADVTAAIAAEQAAIKAGRGSDSRLAELKTEQKKLNAEQIKATVEGEQQAQAARLQVVAQTGERRTALQTLAETKANAETARLQQSGAISAEEAEGRKLKASQNRIQSEIAAEQAKLAVLQSSGPLTNPEAEGDRQQQILASQQAIATQQAELDANRAAKSKAAFATLQSQSEDAGQAILAADQQREIETQKLVNAGVLTAEQAEAKKLSAAKTRIEAELALEGDRLAQINAADIDPTEKENLKRQSLQKTAELQLSLLQNQAQQEESLRQRAIAAFAALQSQSEDAGQAILAADQQREIETQKLVNAGILTVEEAEAKKLSAARTRIEAEINLERDRLAQINAADIDPSDKENLKRQSLQKTAELQLSLLQNQAQQEESLRQRAIAAIERETQLRAIAAERQSTSTQSQILGLDKAQEAQNAITRSLERQSRILEQNASLQKAVSDAANAKTEGGIGVAEKALEIQRKINQESDPKKKKELESVLAGLGVKAGQSELQLIEQKIDLEEELAARKRLSLKLEQAAAQAQLAIALQQQERAARLEVITAKRAQLEAQIALNKAKQAQFDAAAAVRQAALIKDPEERAIAQAQAQSQVQSANLGVQSAQQQVSLADEQRADADRNVEDQKASAEQQQKLLEVQQDAVNTQADFAEKMRAANASLELIDAKANDLATSQGKLKTATDGAASSLSGLSKDKSSSSRAALPARRDGGPVQPGQPYLVGEEGPEVIVPRFEGHVYTAGQTASILRQVWRSPAPIQLGEVGTGDGAILSELQKLNRAIQAISPASPVSNQNTFNLGGQSSDTFGQMTEALSALAIHMRR